MIISQALGRKNEKALRDADKLKEIMIMSKTPAKTIASAPIASDCCQKGTGPVFIDFTRSTMFSFFVARNRIARAAMMFNA